MPSGGRTWRSSGFWRRTSTPTIYRPLPYIKEKLRGRIGIGAEVRAVQAIFERIFNPEQGFATDGGQFDHLFADGEAFPIGKLAARALHTPGHML